MPVLTEYRLCHGIEIRRSVRNTVRNALRILVHVLRGRILHIAAYNYTSCSYAHSWFWSFRLCYVQTLAGHKSPVTAVSASETTGDIATVCDSGEPAQGQAWPLPAVPSARWARHSDTDDAVLSPSRWNALLIACMCVNKQSGPPGRCGSAVERQPAHPGAGFYAWSRHVPGLQFPGPQLRELGDTCNSLSNKNKSISFNSGNREQHCSSESYWSLLTDDLREDVPFWGLGPF